jgi:hypothetical protein
VKLDAKFCGLCGAPTGRGGDKAGPVDQPAPGGEPAPVEEPAPADALNRWSRSGDEFARRIEAADLRGLLRRRLVVEPGTQALVFQRGELAAVVSAGIYDLARLPARLNLAWPASAVVVDAGDTSLGLEYRDLRTREEVVADLTAEVVVRVADPLSFFTNLVHGRESLPKAAVADLVRSACADTVRARVQEASLADLDAGPPWKAALENELRQQIEPALRRNGLELVAIRSLHVACRSYEALRDRRGETYLAEAGADDAERRAALNRRMRETLTADRMNQFASEKEFEDFVRQTEHELGLKDLVRTDEMEELRRTFTQKREDADVARRHTLEKLELEHDLAVFRQRHALSDAEFEHRVRQEREELRTRQENDWEKVQHERRVAEGRREERIAEAETDVRIAERKAELGMRLREKKVALDHEEESQRIAREQEAKDREAKRELERIRALSDVEQARLAADLKKTETMKDLTPDQILALVAKDSPQVAAAIAERAKAQAQAGASAEVRALYERILAGKESEADRLERVMEKAMGSMERVAGAAAAKEREHARDVQAMAGQSMDRLADVAAAKAGAPSFGQQGPQVVCPTCHRQVLAGSKFCDNCGHQFC